MGRWLSDAVGLVRGAAGVNGDPAVLVQRLRALTITVVSRGTRGDAWCYKPKYAWTSTATSIHIGSSHSWQCVRGGVHPWQVASPSQGHTYRDKQPLTLTPIVSLESAFYLGCMWKPHADTRRTYQCSSDGRLRLLEFLPAGGARGKICESPKSWVYIPWALWMSLH